METSTVSAYRPLRAAKLERVSCRGVGYHVNRWDGEHAWWVLLHGWADVGASFQFLADAVEPQRAMIAPDWRGFGDSDRAAGSYWFPDYLADLDALLDHYSPDTAVVLIGHSMGGNVAGLYAGVRPERVDRLILLDSLGLKPTEPAQAAPRYRQWLDELKEAPRYRDYRSFEALADHLQTTDRRLPRDRALFVARAWAMERNGRVELKADPRHRRVNPVLYRRDEAIACWSAVSAPTLLVTAADSLWRRYLDQVGVREQLERAFQRLRIEEIADSGHMLHHDQPERLAALIETWLGKPG